MEKVDKMRDLHRSKPHGKRNVLMLCLEKLFESFVDWWSYGDSRWYFRDFETILQCKHGCGHHFAAGEGDPGSTVFPLDLSMTRRDKRFLTLHNL